jgi:uncharacterized delta-60 repeat protein
MYAAGTPIPTASQNTGRAELNRTRSWPSALLSMILAVFAPTIANAAAGDLDNTFNGNGKVITDVFVGSDELKGIAVQSDGKIVAVGTCRRADNTLDFDGPNFCAVRYNLNGTLDTSFGVNGKWSDKYSIFNSDLGLFVRFDSFGESVHIQADGKILVGGTCNPQRLCFMRLTSNGTNDLPSFAINETFQVSSGTRKIIARPDGKVLMLANQLIPATSATQMTVAGFNANGSVDTSFGTSGKTTFSHPSGFLTLSELKIDAQGRTLALGSNTEQASTGYVVLGRLLANGTADTTFDTDGLAYFQIGGIVATAHSMNIASNGSMTLLMDSLSTYGTFRVNANGSLDTSYGTNGFRLASNPFLTVSSNCIASTGLLAPDDRGIFLGVTRKFGSAAFDFGLCRARINADATPDATFTSENSLFDSLNAASVMSGLSLAFAPDGKIVAGAGCGPFTTSPTPPAAQSFCLQRYEGLSPDFANCYDVDGDGVTNSLTDGLVILRAQLGFRDAAVTNGVSFAASAPRKTWAQLRDFMVFSCGFRVPL